MIFEARVIISDLFWIKLDIMKGNTPLDKKYDYVIIGAGLAGMTAARLLADKGMSVLVLEKLQHIGGSVGP